MNTIINTILILLSFKALSQTERITEFYPLTPIDTINNLNELKKFERIDSLNSSDFFFTYKDREYESGLLFNKKSDDKWFIYELDLEMFSSSNMRIDNFRIEDEKYIFIQTIRFPSGVCSNIYGFLTILNIETCKTIEFCNYNKRECYDENASVSSQSECRITTKLENGILSLKNSENIDRLNCIKSAEYKIKNDNLIKAKYYLDTHKSFYPINCNEEHEICTGMDLNILKRKFSKDLFKKIPLYEYGYDSEINGLEICSASGEPQIFLVDNKETVVGICFISPKYQFNGINTQTKVSDILNKYPNSRLYIDLISLFEYIYIEELKIKLIFKTNESNSIGKYETEMEKGTVEVIRPNATPDFIKI